MARSTAALSARIAEVRDFNRFYTRLIGVLDEGHLSTPFSLAQIRVMYELAHREGVSATELHELLGLDEGYLSRLLRGLCADGLIARRRSSADGRRRDLELTARGRRAMVDLEVRADAAIARVLERVPAAAHDDLVGAMRALRATLEPPPGGAPFVLRDPRPGDLGWVVHRHGVLYAREYGWDARFEGLVARIVSDFGARFDPARERCWIGERGGTIVGSVFLVARARTVAQLRLLYVEPAARGGGLGARLVNECTQFARRAGYQKIMLSTNSGLSAARRIYEAAGYRLVGEDDKYSFGDGQVGQTWELRL